jgi:ubiquinol-cytochrome c reductase cytochrome b subunit
VPALILPGLVFNLAYAWPALERKFTGDNAIHHLLDRPSDRAVRTSVGVATLSFLMMLFIASSTDVIANFFHISLNTVLWAMRILVVLVPLIAYPLSYKICKEMQSFKGAGKRKTTNVVTRTAEGEYVATASPRYVDDVPSHLAPIPVPKFITELDSVKNVDEGNGTRVVDR